MPRTRISVHGFVQRPRLSNSVVLLQGEDDFDECDVSYDGNLAKSRQWQVMENGVRVALMLARSFLHGFQELCENELYPLSSIQLSDFALDFEGQHCAEEGHSLSRNNNDGVPSYSTILLRDMDMNIQQKRSINSEAKATAMQILGGLFFSIFSQGQSPDSLLKGEFINDDDSQIAAASLIRLSQGQGDESVSVSSSQSLKRPRSPEEEGGGGGEEEASVFSKLVRSQAFPLSICRLLSDMIHSRARPNKRGEADIPYTSFHDVLCDLEQMMHRPQVFLHDSYFPYKEPNPPAFGRVFCGRREEVESLMKIADQMEQSVLNGPDTNPRNKDGDCCSSSSSSRGVEAVFVSGLAGSGKSHLVQAVGEALQSSGGWFVTHAKFQKGMECNSLAIVSAMFNELVLSVVKTKQEGQPSADIEYWELVSQTILYSVGQDMFPWLFGFIPSLSLLFPHFHAKETEMPSASQLVYPLSKILEAVLASDPERFIMIVCDDLQWADKMSLSLISEILVNIGGETDIRRQCLFVGTYRSNEIDDSHPFSIQYSYLQTSSYVNTTEVTLSGLSRDDIVDMLMSELKLPGRLVADLADDVYKKTCGHALHVIELLTSLLEESIIVYSQEKHRFIWSQGRIKFATSENVAELIALNLVTLPTKLKNVLRILSCFGIQTHTPLLQVLDGFQQGIMSTMKELVDNGILNQAGDTWMFSHELILQTVYEGMSLAEQRSLHLRIGQYLWGSARGRNSDPCILYHACDQVKSARVEFIADKGQRQTCANWNS